MLLSFTVSNFRSFREEQTFSMVASNRHADHPEHLSPIPDDDNKVLPVAAIYGANGAGKTNLIKALHFFKTLVAQGIRPDETISQQPFRLDKTSKDAPTEFDVQFVEDGRVYRYGVRFTEKFVQAEWLSLVRNSKEINVFERVTNEAGESKVESGPVLKDATWGDHKIVMALASIGVRQNQLFLNTIRQTVDTAQQGPVIQSAMNWFTKKIAIVGAQVTFENLAELIAKDPTFTEFAGRFLRHVATGVDMLHTEEIDVDERMILGGGLSPVVQEALGALGTGDTTVIPAPDGLSQLIVEKGEGAKVRVRTMISEHITEDGDRVNFSFGEESDGTQRLIHLLPALHSLRSFPCIFIIDEIDRSLHPLLSKCFVREFLKLCAGKGSQLIFTTHDTAFLDLDLLRRDEIWFTEKKSGKGATELYSLAEFKVRTDLKIDKGYMQGRFGGVPPSQTEFPEWVNEIIKELKPRSGGDGNKSNESTQ